MGRPLLLVMALAATQGGLLLTLCERAWASEQDHRLGGINKQKRSLVSRLWGLEVQGRGVSKAASFWSLSPWLVVGHLLVSSHPLLSACLCPSLLLL